MSTLFWIAFAGVIYTYVGYPLMMALLARIAGRPWIQTPCSKSVSIVMAVRNGGDMLREQLRSLSALSNEIVSELVVVSDGSSDDTATQLEAFPDPRLRTIVLQENQGKAIALNRGVSQATGEIVLFVDVRPQLHADSLQQLLSNFSDPKVGCVTGELLLKTDGQDGAASAISGLYWRYEQWLRMVEASWDSPLGVYGGYYAARRSLITPFPAGLILDDMFQPLNIVRQGYRTVIDRRAYVSDRWPAEISGEFVRKVRTLAGNYQLIAEQRWLLTPKNRLWLQFVSHKVMRLVAPYLLLLMLLASTALAVQHPLWIPIAASQWVFWTMALLALRFHLPVVHRIASAASAFLVLNAAAVAGLYRYCFTKGSLHKIWTATQTAVMPHAATATPETITAVQEKGHAV